MQQRIQAVSWIIVLAVAVPLAGFDGGDSPRWSTEKANAWQRDQGWLVGCNFIPSTAINQLEMWQADTFDGIRGAGNTRRNLRCGFTISSAATEPRIAPTRSSTFVALRNEKGRAGDGKRRT